MANQVLNENLRAARAARKDEFYTQLTDIEKEIKHYRNHFQDKVVFCNCDDPRVSNFFRYFALNFKVLGLKKLITTCYKNKNVDLFTNNDSEQAVYLEYHGDISEDNLPLFVESDVKPLRKDGDFKSEESTELLKQADIVVTNPPFSLFREYVAHLMRYRKKFIILGNINAVTYKEIFPLIMNNQIWLGYSIHSGDREFQVPNDYPLQAAGWRIDEHGNKFIRVKGVRWFTNLDYVERHENLLLYKKYTPEAYPHFDNYPAINVDKVSEIPDDYDDIIGVPITFLDKYNPGQFEILGITDRANTSGLRTRKYTIEDTPRFNDLNARGVIRHGNVYKAIYARLLIKKRANGN